MATMFRGLVFALPLAFIACGSDDGDDGGNAGTSGTAGSSGSSGLDPRCEMSQCPNEYEPYDMKQACDGLLNSPCFSEHEAYRECLLDNETCRSDGTREVDSISVCDPLSEAIFECADQNGG